jgi:sterol desaturase/sphingolipid hydroxylase (fatty acid hydroxylase superfamily)
MGMKERLFRFRSFCIFPILSVGLLSFTFRTDPRADLRSLPWLIAGGLLAWTLLEYVFHRVLLHAPIPNARLRTFLNGSHVAHHRAPRDPNQILVKPFSAVVISSGLYGVLYLISSSTFVAAGIMTGVWCGFLYYEAVHYRVHMSLSHSPLLNLQRRAHFYHHFQNSKQAYGVTSPLWDYVFRTGRAPAAKISGD